MHAGAIAVRSAGIEKLLFPPFFLCHERDGEPLFLVFFFVGLRSFLSFYWRMATSGLNLAKELKIKQVELK